MTAEAGARSGGDAPANLLDPKVKTAWRIQGLAVTLPVALAALALLGIAPVLGIDTLWPIAALTLAAVVALVVQLIVPEFRYRRWRWEVRDEEIRLQEGLIVRSQTVVPMVRVQHVDTAQGPVMGWLGLMDVHFYTAAGGHTIPALTERHAAELRDRIATLARVTDDGGL